MTSVPELVPGGPVRVWTGFTIDWSSFVFWFALLVLLRLRGVRSEGVMLGFLTLTTALIVPRFWGWLLVGAAWAIILLSTRHSSSEIGKRLCGSARAWLIVALAGSLGSPAYRALMDWRGANHIGVNSALGLAWDTVARCEIRSSHHVESPGWSEPRVGVDGKQYRVRRASHFDTREIEVAVVVHGRDGKQRKLVLERRSEPTKDLLVKAMAQLLPDTNVSMTEEDLAAVEDRVFEVSGGRCSLPTGEAVSPAGLPPT